MQTKYTGLERAFAGLITVTSHNGIGVQEVV